MPGMANDSKALLLTALEETFLEGWRVGAHEALQALTDAKPEDRELRSAVKAKQSELSAPKDGPSVLPGTTRKNLLDALQDAGVAVPSLGEANQTPSRPSITW